MADTFQGMSIPTFIDGVLVHRNFHNWHSKFRFHRYPFHKTALKPGSYSARIPEISPLLHFGIRILYVHSPSHTDTNKHIDLDFPSFFFGYWSGNVRQSCLTTYMVFFRDDFQPLHPKQAEVLWKFCDRVVFDIYPAVQHAYPWVISENEDGDWGQGFDEIVRFMVKLWVEQCTVNNFSAFFDLFRNGKLLREREEWRAVESPCCSVQ